MSFYKSISSKTFFACATFVVSASILTSVSPASAAISQNISSVTLNSSVKAPLGFYTNSVSRANAAAAARDYIRSMAFSRKGLIEQLMFEGYSRKDSTYGVDHLHANWKTQAKLKAKEYLATMPFSRSALIDQLIFEGFTSSQASYGVRKAGL